VTDLVDSDKTVVSHGILLQNYELLLGRVEPIYAINPTGFIPFGDPHLELKFEHRSCVSMVLQILLAPLLCL
jgi:hypothetical protein